MSSNNNDIFLIDGGLSTELNELGYQLNDTKIWTGKSIVNNPNILKQAHLNFLKSGADIIETASYQLSLENLMNELKCSENDSKSIIKQSVQIAKQAREESKCDNIIYKDHALIAGSIGPYGACLCDGSEFSGTYVDSLTIEFLKEWHRPRLECLIEEKCDLIAVETIPSIKEATALISLLSEYPNVKAWLSFSCKNESSLCCGDSFKDAYNQFKDSKQLIAIGINCTYPKYIQKLLESVTNDQIVTKPFIVYSNDGREWDATNQKFITINNTSPIDVVFDSIPKWIQLGAKYIGGCCNISSKDIDRMRKITRKH